MRRVPEGGPTRMSLRTGRARRVAAAASPGVATPEFPRSFVVTLTGFPHFEDGGWERGPGGPAAPPVKFRKGNTKLPYGKIQRCSIEDLYRVWSAPNGSQLLDVREYAEFAREHIPGLRLTPLSGLELHASTLDRQRPTYIVCHWGNRSTQAAKKLVHFGFQDVRIVEGGMLAWTSAELPVQGSTNNVWSLERQVRFTAGALALAGALLAWLVHPACILLSGVIGAGLVFAAVTDTCGMALVLARLPWNQADGSVSAGPPQPMEHEL